MYFAILMAVLTSLAIAETAPPLAAASPFLSGLEVWLVAILLGLVGQIVCRHFANRFRNEQEIKELTWLLQHYRWLRVALIWTWALLSPLALYLSHWSSVVRVNFGLGQYVLLDEVLILAPAMVALLAYWFSASQVEQAMMQRRMVMAAPSSWALFTLQVRHYGGFLLAPVLFALFVGDLSEHFASELEGRQWLPPLLLVGGLLFVFPLALRRIWPTAPLAKGPLRERLEATSSKVGMRVREILVWRTGGCLVNAAIVGFTGMFRYLMLTDELLNRLSDDEIESVLLHEAAHVRRRHLILRMGLVGSPLLLWFIAVSCQPGGAPLLFANGSNASSLAAAEIWLVLILPAMVGLYCVVSLCWVSRQLEFDADLAACRLAGACETARAQYISMLDTLADASGARRDQRSWLHPSINERMALIASLDQSSGQVEAFQRCLRLTIGVFVLLGAAAPAWILFRMLVR